MSGGAADLRISGYASLFGQTDMGGDTVQRGAFAAAILALGGNGLPMLLGHEQSAPIGVWDRVTEDGSGLFVSGWVIGGDARAERTARLVRFGALSGLSIGYQARRAQRTASGRALLEIDLWEVSIVAFPMLRAARITQIGSPLAVNDEPTPIALKRSHL